MSRKKLHKSSDAVISGVCGGIAEYFGIDPTLVRILAVVICIAGFGLPVIFYVICMIAFPPDPAIAQGYVDAHAEPRQAPCQRMYASVVADAEQPPPPDPATRVSAVTGARTVAADAGDSAPYNAADAPRSHRSSALLVGAVLVGIGVIALLCNLIHISVWRFWPLVIVAAGLICLFTPGPRGWSLERAGNSIVLITFGLALLLWMLQIVQTRIFIAAFLDLWPALLVVVGLSVIGNARKSSVIILLSSLVLSATMIFGIWFYAGLDWASLGSAMLLAESDGIHEFLTDLSLIR